MAFIHRQSSTHRLDILRLIFIYLFIYLFIYYFFCVFTFRHHTIKTSPFLHLIVFHIDIHLRFNLGQPSIYHDMSICKPSLFNLQLLRYFVHMNLSSPSYHFKIIIQPFLYPCAYCQFVSVLLQQASWGVGYT